MVQPTVYVYDSETGEWVTPEELKRRQADRAIMRRAVEDRVSALLQGAVISSPSLAMSVALLSPCLALA